jgi:hypothetical protein
MARRSAPEPHASAAAPRVLIAAERWLTFAAAGWLILCIGFAAGTIHFIARHYRRVPYWDHWVWIAGFHDGGFWRVAFAQFNEHRIFFPSVFYTLDFTLFGGRNEFLLAILLMTQLACLVMLVRPLWIDRGCPRAMTFVVSGVASVLMFWLIQIENIAWPYQLCTLLANFGGLAAFTALAAYAQSHRVWMLAAAIASAVVGTFSFAHGMLIWPVLLVLAAGCRLPWRPIAIVAGCFAVVFILYMIGYRTPGAHNSPLDALGRPHLLLQYIVVLIGLPVFGINRSEVAFLPNIAGYMAGVAGIFLGCAIVIRFVFFSGRERRPADIVYSGAVLLCLGSAFITALGRINFSVVQALSSRYATVTLIFWIAILASLTLELARWESGTRGLGRTMWCVLLALLIPRVAPAHVDFARQHAARERLREASFLSMVVGAPDRERLTTDIYPVISTLDNLAPWLQSGRKSLYSWPQAEWIGARLSGRVAPAPAAACSGAVESTVDFSAPSGAASRVQGWGWDASTRTPPARIVLTDAAGVVIGLGVGEISRPDLAAAHPLPGIGDAGWSGYARSAGSTAAVAAWAMLADGRACPLP